MDVFLETLGCRLNEAEIESFGRALKHAGHGVASAPEKAHVVVLNSCTVTAEATRKSRKLVRRLRRQNPRAKLVLTGCYAQIAADEAAAIDGVDLVLGNTRKQTLVEELIERFAHYYPPKAHGDDSKRRRTRAFVKVQDGCHNRCTYCVVSLARGKEHSRSVSEIVDEIDSLQRNGAKEVVLTGAHLGAYGRGLGVELYGLVDTLLHRTSIQRLRLSSLEPWDIPPRMWRLWQNPRLCPHLHLPLQSGSDRILQLMGRRCDTGHYWRLAQDAYATIPDLCLTTDIIVGFPGENDEDWAQTMAFVEALGFAHVHIFSYSPRPGTAAAKMPNQIPDQTKHQRSQALHLVAQRMGRRALEAILGKRRNVLWEGPGKMQADGSRVWTGRTDNYLKAHTVSPSHAGLENKITQTEFFAVEGDRLRGRIVSPLG